MKLVLFVLAFLLVLALQGCSNITLLRTKEMRTIAENSNKQTATSVDSLRAVIDSIRIEQDKFFSRLKSDVSELIAKVNAQDDKMDSRMEEIAFRLDRVSGLTQQQQKNVAKKTSQESPSQAATAQNQELETLYKTSRSDYIRGEYAIAYNGFKQIYETLKEGELAENSFYWMAVCMLDVGQKANAETLLKNLLELYPQSGNVCTAIYKLATMAEDDGNKNQQKLYLQKLLDTKHCSNRNEFQRAAEQLEGM